MKEYGASLLYIFAAILIVSCDKNSVQLVSQEATAALEKNWHSQVLPMRNIKGVDIYYDATPSMGGFVHDAGYKKLVSQDVENAKPADVSARFYKATTDLPLIIQEIKSPVEAGRADFYQKGNTRLDAIIDTADVGNISVVITDLFQTNVDINRVCKAITTRYLQDTLSVAIIAIKVPFKGTVYDVGYSQNRFEYKGDRPVYVLVFGPHVRVDNYIEKLTNFMQVPDAKVLMLSPFLVSPASTFHKVVHMKNMVAKNLLHSRLPFIKEFLIRDSDKVSSFGAEVAVSRLKHTTPWSNDDLKMAEAIHPSMYVQGENRFDLRPNLGRAADIKFQTINAGSIQIETDIDAELLSAGMIYQFPIQLEISGSVLPEWVSEWDMDINKLGQWATGAEEFDGSTTLNLRTFLARIQSDINEIHKTKIIDLQLFIKKGL